MNITLKITFATLLLLLIMLSAFFSASETAYTSVSPVKIKTYEKQGKRWAKLVCRHYKSFGWTLATILLSNNIVNVALSSLTTYLVNDLLQTGAITTIVSIAMVTPVLVVLGEVVPKILARKHAVGYLKKVVYIMNFFNYLFLPLTFPLSKITLSSKVTNTEKEIQALLSVAHSEGVLETNEATLAQKALELDSKKVKAVMTPSRSIIWLKSTATVRSAKRLFAASGFSRILVRGQKGYVGYLILKDIIFAPDEAVISKFVVATTYVSQAIIVSKALEKMRINNAHIALVTTSAEATVVVGIITIEDIIEELVGEIYDEHDPIEKVREIAHFKYIVNGSTRMDVLAREIDFEFPGAQHVTVKQWVQARINRKIKQALKYTYQNKIIFTIIKNSNNAETIIQVFKKNN